MWKVLSEFQIFPYFVIHCKKLFFVSHRFSLTITPIALQTPNIKFQLPSSSSFGYISVYLVSRAGRVKFGENDIYYLVMTNKYCLIIMKISIFGKVLVKVPFQQKVPYLGTTHFLFY